MTSTRSEERPEADANVAATKAILLIEDSLALSVLLEQRLEAETDADIVRCDTMAAAHRLLESRTFTLALTGLNFADAPDGEILDLLLEYNVPTIVFTARFDAASRARYAQKKIIDYIVKDGQRTVDAVLATVNRILGNRSFSVLVVDDARSTRSGLVDILTRQNFRVIETWSGQEALDILANNEAIELVITDYHMPDMDGYELTRRIRARRSSDGLRIVGVSASSDSLLSAAFLKAGASDFIYRPFVLEELQCRIDNNIETLKQIKRLRYLAERDHLTGLPNRRCFFEKSHAFMQAGAPGPRNGAIAILDIDHFKTVNDTFGHEAGDQVLKALADVLTRLCAEGKHLAARLGGEEFSIYFLGLNAMQAHSLCETIRARIADTIITVAGTDISVTASIGMVEIEAGEPFDNQLNAADQLLYMAKANGRNRVYSNLTLQQAMRLQHKS